MPDITINGVIVSFPFKPYNVQEEYMKKVIECLQDGKNGVLESPTGTGKTLCLLCSTLSWLLTKKAQMQAESMMGAIEKTDFGGHFFKQLKSGLNEAVGTSDAPVAVSWVPPKIIYASRTHSQLSQAMQELKRTSYKHVTTTVLGSRDQLCIDPQVSKETNTFNKIHMCQSKVKSGTCIFYNRVEKEKVQPLFKQEVLDIEDLVKAGQKLKCCPYFLVKELKQSADITFMPYNYLLDSRAQKSQGIQLENTIIILDEAHNVEKTCEEAASLQISSTDIAMCIDEITFVMEAIKKDAEKQNDDFSMEMASNVQKDFTPDDLCILKAMFLELEKAIDSIEIKKREEGETFPGGYIFELLEKAQLTHGKEQLVTEKLDKIILYLTTTSTSPFARKGNALQKFNDLLRIVFSSSSAKRYRNKIKQCYKVYIQFEEPKRNNKGDVWETKKTLKSEGKLISYWCFSPGFSMQRLVDQGVRSVILTSGTLSPMKPFISELGIPIDVQLENPHIVKGHQVCVGVLSQGPDGHTLNSSFNTRNDPKYIASLGRTIFNFSCLIPHGLLVFFPSYPIMKKCREEWQNSGLWTKIADRKSIYVEPQYKDGFVNVMNEYCQKIRDPSCNGAIFMAVCRGKVSEGLDFANANGRAVLITGLPFPPLKDPRVMLKQRYLDEMRSTNKEALTGQHWYQLEASRAVNQAIGRIIRHKNDYGAIILCDCRFENPNFQKHLSAWLRPQIKKFDNFGVVTKELKGFFRYAENTLPQPTMVSTRFVGSNDSLPAMTASFDAVTTRSNNSSKSRSSATSTAETKDNFSLDFYTKVGENSEVSKQSPVDLKNTNFFDLFEIKAEPVINFGHCKLKENYTTCELTRNSNLAPPSKKRKIKILPVEFNESLSRPSTSSASSTQNANAPENSQQISADVNNSTDQRALGKVYLNNVKLSLSKDNYEIFAKIIKEYKRNANFEELLKVLKSLFPPNKGMMHLLIGFQSFLKKQHITAFQEHVAAVKKNT